MTDIENSVVADDASVSPADDGLRMGDIFTQAEIAQSRQHAPLTCSCPDDIAVVLAFDTGCAPVLLHDAENSRYEFDEGLEEELCNAGLARPLKTLDGRSYLEHAVKACVDAGVREVYLLRAADSRMLDGEVTRLVGSYGVRDFAVEQGGLYDGDGACDVFGVRHVLLQECAELLKGTRVGSASKEDGDSEGGASGVFLLSACQPTVTARHVFALKERCLSEGACDIAATWSQWRVVPPMYVPAESFPLLLEPVKDGSLRHFHVAVGLLGEEDVIGLEAEPDNMETLAGHATAALDEVLGRRERDAEDKRAWDVWAASNKTEFPQLMSGNRFVYLDNAATTMRPKALIDKLREVDAGHSSNVSRGYYGLELETTRAYDEARASVASFIGAKPYQVVFTSNCTGASNLVARAWGACVMREGDVVAVCDAGHHSGMLPWQILSARTGCGIALFGVGADGRIDMASYERALARRPRIVSFPAIGNVLGIRAPVEEMVDMAHACGARVVLDCAQSIAHEPTDVQGLDVDFIVFSAHKMYGPTGLGVLYVKEDAIDEMGVVEAGGGSISFVSDASFYPRKFPFCLEPGTPPISQIIGFGAVCEYLRGLDMRKVAEHDKELTGYAYGKLSELPFAVVWGDHTQDDGLCGLLSISLCGVKSQFVSSLLGAMGIQVRGDTHCAIPLFNRLGVLGAVRMSSGIYTTHDDVDVFVEGLKIAYRFLRSCPTRW